VINLFSTSQQNQYFWDPPYSNHLYKECTEKLPLECHLHKGIFLLYWFKIKVLNSNSKEHHSLWYSPTNWLLKNNCILSEEKTCETVILELLEMKNNKEYLQAREYSSFHLSIQNKIDSPSLTFQLILTSNISLKECIFL
jgi:hypothetical protein